MTDFKGKIRENKPSKCLTYYFLVTNLIYNLDINEKLIQMKKLSTYFNVALLVLATTFFMTSCNSDKSAESEATVQTQPKVVQPKKLTRQQQAQKIQAQQRLQAQQKNRQAKPRPTYEPGVPGGKINWMTFEEAEKAMKKKPKKVFVDVYTDWCGWCKRLDKATFADKRVADYMNENFYPVKFDAQHPGPISVGGKKYENPGFDTSKRKNQRNTIHQLARKYQATGYPTVLFLNEKLDLVKAVSGYKSADAFLPLLEQYKSL